VQELGGHIARQIAKLVNGNIPYHRCYVQFMNGGWPEAESSLFFIPLLPVNSVFFGSSTKSMKSAIDCWTVRKTAMCIACFAYSSSPSSSLGLGLGLGLLLVLVLILIFPFLSLSQPTSIPFCPFLLPVLLVGKDRGERAAVWCLAASCWVKP